MANLTDYAGELVSVAKEIRSAGSPQKWLFARITEFMIGLVIGAVTGVADSLAGALRRSALRK